MRHYINARNILDGLEPDHGFGSSYRSCLTAYAAFVEDDSRFSQSILDQYDNNTDVTMVNFACEGSVEAFTSEKLQKLTVAPSTVSGMVASIQKWIDVIEPKEKKFNIKDISKTLRRSLSVQKAAHKNVKKKNISTLTSFPSLISAHYR